MTTDTTKCPVCDRPTPTSEQWLTMRGGEGPELCWWGADCAGPRVDWRARALAAEAERDAERSDAVRALDELHRRIDAAEERERAAVDRERELRGSLAPKPQDCKLDLAAIEARRVRAVEVNTFDMVIMSWGDVPGLVRELRRVLDLFARERAVRLSYEDGITWETSCLSCAALLTQCRAQQERAEKAEAIAAGSAVLPTEREIAAVDEANGFWFIAFRGRCAASNAESVRSHVRGAEIGWWQADEARWWPCVGGVIVARPAAPEGAAKEPRCGSCDAPMREGATWCSVCRRSGS